MSKNRSSNFRGFREVCAPQLHNMCTENGNISSDFTVDLFEF